MNFLVRSLGFAFLLVLLDFKCSDGLRGWWRRKRVQKSHECRYKTYKTTYTGMRTQKLQTQCHSDSLPCFNPNYPPRSSCSIDRCTLKKISFPYKKIQRQIKTDCCSGWEKDESSYKPGCTVETCITLPQFTPANCSKARQEKLEVKRGIYRFTNPPDPAPQVEVTAENLKEFVKVPVVNLTVAENTALASQNAHEQGWVKTFFALGKVIGNIRKNTLSSGKFNNLEKFSDYAKIIDEFHEGINASLPTEMGEMCKFPSNEEDFKDIITDDVWQDDKVFVEQRLAGHNPMSIRMLGLKEYIERRSQFNPVLDEEIEKVSKESTNMEEMVKKGLVYILEYPDMNNITTMSDVTDLDPNDERHMTSFTSPIAIFVSLIDSFSGKRELKPLAIQTDFTGSSPVFTPRDGSKWLLAKEIVQRADLHYVQIVEHLLKTHLLLGAMCLSIQRHISEYHPLYDVLKYHCRAVLVTNSLAFPSLLAPDASLRKLLTTGNAGCLEMVNSAFLHRTWKDANFVTALRKRGVMDATKLPYFPYRDDGIIMWEMVKEFARELVDLYYHNSKLVSGDKELQNFANELSDKGTGPDGGNGMVQDFPNKIKSRRQLTEILARIFFIPIQHSAVNYPVSYYTAFVPNMPSKIYDDPRTAPEAFSIHSLPQNHVATPMVALAMGLSALRYDHLFDYHPDLQDKKAAELVAKYYNYLNGPVLKELKSRNKQRLDAGHLTYPYLQPGWIPNSIHI